MTRFDFSPLFRSTVGFDRVMNLLETATIPSEDAYPPYNIEKLAGDAYRITMAVAGFGEGDLQVEAKENALLVSGRIGKGAGNGRTYLHRGIAGRGFKRSFQLAEHVKVTGAALENGLLHIDLVRELPEAKRPRAIDIRAVAPKRLETEQRAA